MGISLGLIVILRGAPLLFALVALLALGMYLVSPNLAALISRGGGTAELGQRSVLRMRPTALVRRAARCLGCVIRLADELPNTY